MVSQMQYQFLAAYNKRMNDQLLTVVEQQCSPEQLRQDKGVFFRSILGTFNHILVGDLIWLKRFSTYSERYNSLKSLTDLPEPKHLDQCLFDDFTEFRNARRKVDDHIITWIEDEIYTEDFAGNLSYFNTQGIKSERNFGALVTHLFNHQTHHRGQISSLLNQLDLDIGSTDLLIEIPELS